jgi:hypothetical protein
MVHYVRLTLVGSHKADGAVLPDDLVNALHADFSQFLSFGSGGRWQSAGFVVLNCSLTDFQDQAEPSERFFQSVRDSLVTFAKWLSGVALAGVEMLRLNGYEVQLVIDISIDQNQMEFNLPWELMRETGRLKFPVKIISND